MKTTKRLTSIALVLCMIMATATTAFAATFTDVPESHWSYEFVEKAYANELIAGVGNNKYNPDANVSNAAWNQMVANMLWEDIYHMEGNPWWFEAMRYNWTCNWLDGTTMMDHVDYKNVQMFSDEVMATSINRYDMAQVIYNIAMTDFTNLTVNTDNISEEIPDYQSIPSKYRTAVEYCYAAGFIVGNDNQGTFAGENLMTRGAAATVLTRMFDAVNNNWTVPDKNTETNPNPDVNVNNTAVKDMITTTTPDLREFDYEIVVTNTYTAGKLSNGKDITEANINAMLDELEAIYPQGTPWDDIGSVKLYYYASSSPASGGGCNAFVGMTADILFGKGVKWTSSTTLEDAKAGDLIQLKDENGTSRHWMVVMSTKDATIEQYSNGKLIDVDTVILTICDGNDCGSVFWNIDKAVADLLLDYPNSVLYTAY